MSNPNQSNEPTLIFIHILKTAGTTLNTIIEKHYPPHRTFATFPVRHHPDGSLKKFMQLTDAEKANIDVLYGHMSYGLHEHLPRPARYFTILRDPVERVISRYFHIRRDVHSQLHEEIASGEMDLGQFARHMAESGEMDNLQTRMIAGNWNERGYGPCDEAMLAQAKQNLQKFVVVGLTERFDETCLLIQRAFGWPDMYYTSRNVTKRRPPKEQFSADVLKVVAGYNRYDMALYDYAVELFEEQVRQQGPSFRRDVTWFQWKNGRLKPLRQLYWQARKVSVRVFIKKQLARLRHQSS